LIYFTTLTSINTYMNDPSFINDCEAFPFSRNWQLKNNYAICPQINNTHPPSSTAEE